MTAENIIVEPINREKLANFLNNNVGKKENQEFIIDSDSIFIHENKSLLIDNECCAGELKKHSIEQLKNLNGKSVWEFGNLQKQKPVSLSRCIMKDISI